MVKVEDHADNDYSSDGEFLYRQNARSSNSMPSSSTRPVLVKEENLPSSSSSHLRSCFVGMGFSSVLVDKVIEETGCDDENLILQALIDYSKSSPEAADSLDGFSDFKTEDNPQITLSSDDEQETKKFGGCSVSELDKKSYLSIMDFSEEEINLAIATLGENAPLPELVDFIVTAQTAGSSVKTEMDGLVYCDKEENEETTTATLFGTMDKTLCLLRMGFTENEVSTVIDKYGPEVSIHVLADSIFASRMAFSIDKEEDLWDDTTDVTLENHSGPACPVQATDGFLKRCRPTTEPWITKASTSNDAWITKASSSNDPWITKASSSNDAWITKASSSNDPCITKASSPSAALYEVEDVKTSKKAKYKSVEDDTASTYTQQGREDEWQMAYEAYESKPDQYQEAHEVKEELPDLRTLRPRPNANGVLSRPPYVFYANLVDVPLGTWKKLSQFLYAIEPEFVNTQFFSALIRKEGYLHNLPTEKRFHIVPKPPTTIEDTLPHTKKCWPSWDTRKQLSCINSETTGVIQLCERLGKIMMDSLGFITKEQQMDILHQCKRLNLIWVGQHKLRPIEPDQLESILGYPMHHTDIWGSEPAHRLEALRYCFQIDTVGYHLSVLKSMYPNGLRVLSIFSGIGGAEIALHRLGIHLKCVVSVEASEINRKILKRWWVNTGQTGVLKQIGGIERQTSQTLESLTKQFGGFDIIIGLHPGDSIRGSSRDSSGDMDMKLFYEFIRAFQIVRGVMGRRS